MISGIARPISAMLIIRRVAELLIGRMALSASHFPKFSHLGMTAL